MLSSLFTGTTGLKSNMSSMSVIGNNLANMNTIGFKASKVTFADLMSQNMNSLQGTNQIGLGVFMSGVTPIFSQGSLESTASASDLAIEGDGLFMVNDSNNATYYTRAGQFNFDKDGYLVDPLGNNLQGYMADSLGNIGSTTEDLRISLNPVQPNATTAMDIVANLNSDSSIMGYVFNTGVNDEVTFTLDPGGTPTQITASLITNDGLVDGTAYTGDQVAAAIQAAMENTAPGSKFSVAYTPLDGSFSITNDAGNVPVELNWSLSNVGTGLGFNATDSGVIAAGGNDVSDVTAGAFDVTKAVETSNFSTSMNVFDSLGNPHQVSVYFRKDEVLASGNTWNWYAVVDAKDSASGLTEIQAQGVLDFNTSGALNSESAITYLKASGGFDFSGGAGQGQALTFDFGSSITEGSDGLSGVTQYGQDSVVYRQGQNGYTSGSLQRSFIDKDGMMMGVFSNGVTRAMAQIALAQFSNMAGLEKEGGNLYTETNSSGQPLVSAPGLSGVGEIHSNALELSNVDISEEFVKMITAQRGFQANSRVITTTDEMLVELVNLKR